MQAKRHLDTIEHPILHAIARQISDKAENTCQEQILWFSINKEEENLIELTLGIFSGGN